MNNTKKLEGAFMWHQAVIILICSTIYAVLRYTICGPVELVHLPSYLLNKATAMSSVGFLMLMAMAQMRQQPERMKYWGRMAMHTVCVHVLLSLALLSPERYPKFYADGQLILSGELTVLLGCLAAYCFIMLACKSDWMQRYTSLYRQGALLLISGHLVCMGLSGWLTPSYWHGGLPPISLLSFGFTVGAFLLELVAQYSVTSERRAPQPKCNAGIPRVRFG